VSQDTGFETLSSFNRMFRKTYQMPPREWRRMQQAQPNDDIL
jgi:AraC-like DNA-binding protein